MKYLYLFLLVAMQINAPVLKIHDIEFSPAPGSSLTMSFAQFTSIVKQLSDAGYKLGNNALDDEVANYFSTQSPIALHSHINPIIKVLLTFMANNTFNIEMPKPQHKRNRDIMTCEQTFYCLINGMILINLKLSDLTEEFISAFSQKLMAHKIELHNSIPTIPPLLKNYFANLKVDIWLKKYNEIGTSLETTDQKAIQEEINNLINGKKIESIKYRIITLHFILQGYRIIADSSFCYGQQSAICNTPIIGALHLEEKVIYLSNINKKNDQNSNAFNHNISNNLSMQNYTIFQTKPFDLNIAMNELLDGQPVQCTVQDFLDSVQHFCMNSSIIVDTKVIANAYLHQKIKLSLKNGVMQIEMLDFSSTQTDQNSTAQLNNASHVSNTKRDQQNDDDQ